MRTLFILPLVATVALAQGKPTPARDGGVTTSRLVAVDAGVPLVTPGPTPELEKLRKELNDLKLRTTELERAQQAKVDALNAELDKLGKRVDELKTQLQKVAEAEERRSDAEEAAAAKKVALAAASTSVNAVLVQLASGNTSGIEPSLRYAENTFTGSAQKDVQLARSALGQGDVAAARLLLLLALIEADSQR
ncbi:MAG: hypothetical protein Q8L48_13970 [Archangium sp.]|nr:hypothetical protein [Archangium sp.]